MKRIILRAFGAFILFACLLLAGQAFAIPWTPGPTGGYRVTYNPGGHAGDPIKITVTPVSTIHVSYKTVSVMSWTFRGACLQWVRTRTLTTYTDKTVDGVTEHAESVTDLGTDVIYEFCFGR